MAGEGAPRVAAIVLNYNGREITLQALASLEAMTYPACELIHIDNGSRDGSSEAVAAAHPEVTQIRVEENRGVVYGMNQGIELAVSRGVDYLLLLNNDIEVEPDFLDELVAAAETDPAIGCVGPKIFYHGERDRLWSAGGRIRFRESMTRERGEGEVDRGQYDRDEEVPYVNGCAMLVRRSVVEEIGLWDPLFHLALDDADWCMRMKARGYRCYYAHRAVLYHMVARTVGGYRASRTFFNGRSAALFVRRYGGPLQWCSFLAFLSAGLFLAFFRELARGNQGAVIAKLRGVIEGGEPMAPPPRVGGGGRMLKNLREDTRRLREIKTKPFPFYVIESLLFENGYQAVVLYRIAHWFKSHRIPVLGPFFARLSLFLTSVDIAPGARIGPGLFISHGVGLVIGNGVRIGSYGTLLHQVTIGAPTGKRLDQMPTLGDNVFVGTGSRLIGQIEIGDDVFIGVNCAVTRDIPAGTKVTSTADLRLESR